MALSEKRGMCAPNAASKMSQRTPAPRTQMQVVLPEESVALESSEREGSRREGEERA